MRYVEVRDARVSAIGLGCWQFGSRDWGYGQEFGATTARDLVRTALDLGVTLIDTAEAYARGASEAIVGRAIAHRRGEGFVATKFTPLRPTAAAVVDHGIQSALRLGVDAIDLYQIHWPNPAFPLRPQMEGMRTLLDDGVVRHAGVSNFSAERWARADELLGRPVLSNQVHYSLLGRRPERAVVPYAETHDRIVIAYSPLEMGVLGGRYSAAHPPANAARGRNPLCLPENLARAEPLLAALRRVATAHDATPAQVALAWLLRRPNVVAIPGASSVEQLRHNAAAADLELTDDEAAELTAESDRFTPVGRVEAARGLWRGRSTPVPPVDDRD